MEKNNVKDRVLARVTAADLTEVIGGIEPMNADSGTSTVTGEPQGNLNGSDITNYGGDQD